MGRGDLLASPRASACVRVACAAVRALVGRARERRVIRMVKSAFLGYVSVFLEGIHFQTGKIPLPYRALQVNLATHIGKMRVATANEPGNARSPGIHPGMTHSMRPGITRHHPSGITRHLWHLWHPRGITRHHRIRRLVTGGADSRLHKQW